jgi:purine-binding chemotaxis protein CheW
MLVTRVGGMACALPIEHVVETLRPLPVEPLGGRDDEALALIDGVAMIRGAVVPVVDARKLLGVSGEPATRFVVVRAGERRIALAVDAVLDVVPIEPDVVSELPPLLCGARADRIAAIGAHDAGLMVVLDAARVIPEDSWRALDRSRVGRADP